MKLYEFLLISTEKHRTFSDPTKWRKIPKIGQNLSSRKHGTEDIFAKVIFILI